MRPLCPTHNGRCCVACYRGAGLCHVFAFALDLLDPSQRPPILHGLVNLGELAAAVVFDGEAFRAAFADGHGVAGVLVVEGLLGAAVVGDFAVGAGVAIDVAGRIDPTVIHAILLYGLEVNLDAEAGLFWNSVVAAAKLDGVGQQLALPDIHAGNGRPLALGADRAQVAGPRGGNARADELEPERFVGHVGDRGLLRDAVGSSADDKAIGDVFLQGGENRRRAVVHGQRAADVVADLGVAGHIGLGDGRLNHGHLRVLLQG